MRLSCHYGLAKDTPPVPQLFGSSKPSTQVNLELVTVAGTEYTMQANLAHYEDMAELEDDILCFLPTVSDLEVFGCELELLDLREQQPLSEAFRTVLLQRLQLQIVVRPCMVEGHSIWHFQTDGKEGYPKAVRVPANPRGEIADRAFYAAPSIRHVEVATGIQHIGIAAWQSCQQLQIVKLSTSVVSLAEGTFMGCYVLRQIAAPGCVHYGQRVFAECCSLGSVGVKRETEDSSVLAPGAQLGRWVGGWGPRYLVCKRERGPARVPRLVERTMCAFKIVLGSTDLEP